MDTKHVASYNVHHLNITLTDGEIDALGKNLDAIDSNLVGRATQASQLIRAIINQVKMQEQTARNND